MTEISGGYYIKARKIQESDIAHAPPHFREIWDWLIKEASHEPKKKYGIIIERGQCVCSYSDIQEGLHWMIGWRKMNYSRHDCENAMKYLKKGGMIATRKTTHGILITVINYDIYQNPKNYESHRKMDTKATRKPQESHTFNKEELKNLNNKRRESVPGNGIPEWIPKDLWADFKEFRIRIKAPLTDRAVKNIISELEKFKNEGQNPEAVINQSITRGWRGVFPIKPDGINNQAPVFNQNQEKNRLNEQLRKIQEREKYMKGEL